jgi:hypothetical protein
VEHFNPAIDLSKKFHVIYIVEGQPAAAKAIVGDGKHPITTLKAIVRDKLKVIGDPPELPHTSEVQCAKWLQALDQDLSVFIGPADAVTSAYTALLGGKWSDAGLHSLV